MYLTISRDLSGIVSVRSLLDEYGHPMYNKDGLITRTHIRPYGLSSLDVIDQLVAAGRDEERPIVMVGPRVPDMFRRLARAPLLSIFDVFADEEPTAKGPSSFIRFSRSMRIVEHSRMEVGYHLYQSGDTFLGMHGATMFDCPSRMKTCTGFAMSAGLPSWRLISGAAFCADAAVPSAVVMAMQERANALRVMRCWFMIRC